MTEKEFLNAQKAAVERMREMNSRSAYYKESPHTMPPVPSFVKLPNNQNERSGTSFDRSEKPKPQNKDTAPDNNFQKFQKPPNINNSKIGLPFFDKILKDSDTTLIIGLLLLLMSENADKKLLFALVYILL